MRYTIYLLVITALLLASCSSQQVKIACVGDSITEGFGLKNQSQTSYPAELNNLLGPDTSVINFGRSATTMSKTGDFPYWTAKEFSNVFEYQPDIIIIKLGTNDTKPHNWDANAYRSSYQAMIDTFSTIGTHPRIFVCKPVPAFDTKWGINDSTLVNGVIPVVEEIAEANNLKVIDCYTPMVDKGQYFFDSIHPDTSGTKIMAEIISKQI